jgi:hypothetical protein
MRTDSEDYREDDELLEDEDRDRSIFAAGWFRAVLVLTVLAIAVVVALPYMLEWFEPSPVATKTPPHPAQSADSSGRPSATVPPPNAHPPAPVPEATPTPAPPTAPAKSRAPAAVAAGSQRAATLPSVRPSLPPPPPRTASDIAPASERASVPSAKSPDASLPSAKTADLKPGAPASHWVQVGLFKDASNADALARKVRQQGFPVQVARVKRDDSGPSGSSGSGGAYLLVRAGGYPDRSAAISARAALSAKGYPGFLTEGSAK